jgi:filamentous hemagglutinin
MPGGRSCERIAGNNRGLSPIPDALRYSGLKDENGNVIVAADSQETYVNAKPLNPVSADLTLSQNQRQNAPFVVDCQGSACTERLPQAPSQDLMNFIVANSRGSDSVYFFNNTGEVATTSSTPYEPRYFPCASVECLTYGANRNPNSAVNQTEDQDFTNKLTAAGIIIGAPVAVAFGGPVLYGAGAAAQTVPMVGGAGALSSGKWLASFGAGAFVGMGFEILTNPEASPASLTVAGLGGGIGSSTKLGLNATFGLANQWIPTTAVNFGTAIAGSQIAGRAVKEGLNQTGDTTSGASWWTLPVIKCGPFPRIPC